MEIIDSSLEWNHFKLHCNLYFLLNALVAANIEFEFTVCCALRFQALNALLADDNKFGFIVMDGNGALFGTLCGNTREVLHKFTVDLPKKHGQ